jgi:hypothetical protein
LYLYLFDLITCGAKKFTVARARTVECKSLRDAFKQRSGVSRRQYKDASTDDKIKYVEILNLFINNLAECDIFQNSLRCVTLQDIFYTPT